MSDKQQEKKKGFLARFIERMDKKLEEKAKSKPSCCSGGETKEGKSCCG